MNPSYWDKIYSEKDEKQVSWFQEVPSESIQMIEELALDHDSEVLDVGGGESRLVEYFLENDFKNISILDISEVSLQKLRDRLGGRGSRVEYITSDILNYQSEKLFKLWHDRATFHFLTSVEQVEKYLKIAYDHLDYGGHLIVSTFSKTGPDKCSNLPVSKYSDFELKILFGRYFENTRCFETSHTTPWGATQDFVYCGFKKR